MCPSDETHSSLPQVEFWHDGVMFERRPLSDGETILPGMPYYTPAKVKYEVAATGSLPGGGVKVALALRR